MAVFLKLMIAVIEGVLTSAYIRNDGWQLMQRKQSLFNQVVGLHP